MTALLPRVIHAFGSTGPVALPDDAVSKPTNTGRHRRFPHYNELGSFHKLTDLSYCLPNLR
jgi:hypothetical protein